MARSERQKQKKHEKRLRKERHRQTEQAVREQQRKVRLQEFSGSYVDEYRRLCERALKEHSSLVGILECEDNVIYDMDTEERLEHFGLGDMSEVLLDCTDEIDLAADPTTKDGLINANQSRRDGVSVTGCTTVVTSDDRRRTVVFMRKTTGGNDDPEVIHASKLTALVHELGHVTDFEKRLNYHESTVDLVNTEVFAHHHACKALIRGKYRLPLGYYLDGIEEMSRSDSEYVRRAAALVIESKEYKEYKREVSVRYSRAPDLSTAGPKSRAE